MVLHSHPREQVPYKLNSNGEDHPAKYIHTYNGEDVFDGPWRFEVFRTVTKKEIGGKFQQ